MAKQEISWAEIKELFKETDKRFKETDLMIKETIAALRKETLETRNMFTSQWGRLLESLVAGDLIDLLNERNIPVKELSERHTGSYNGHNYEWDIVALNGPSVVVVEVKTTLKPKDVKNFIIKLKNFKIWSPVYSEQIVYGAVAYLKADAGAEIMAQNKGLFVIRATGDSASIINPEDFNPRAF